MTMDQEQEIIPAEAPSGHLPLTTAQLEAELRDYPASMRVVIRSEHTGDLWEAEAVETIDPRTHDRVLLIKAY